MSYSELLSLPVGEKRSFHDDISTVVIRLNGKSYIRENGLLLKMCIEVLLTKSVNIFSMHLKK